MDKRTVTVILGLGFAAGVAAAAFVLQRGPIEISDRAGSRQVAASPAIDAGVDQRLRSLETLLIQERQARQLLEDEILALHEEITALQAADGVPDSGEADSGEPQTEAARPDRRREQAIFQSGTDARTSALLDAGFSPDRAAYILRRDDELRVAAMQSRFEAQRTGDTRGMFDAAAASVDALRQELGDAEYERYLDAMNRPTSVRVGNVLESSPGQRAGLQRGDEIVRYDGIRVFDYTDLNRQQLDGAPGQDVVVEIVRDGVSMEIVMPRGPIGIEATRRWRR